MINSIELNLKKTCKSDKIELYHANENCMIFINSIKFDGLMYVGEDISTNAERYGNILFLKKDQSISIVKDLSNTKKIKSNLNIILLDNTSDDFNFLINIIKSLCIENNQQKLELNSSRSTIIETLQAYDYLQQQYIINNNSTFCSSAKNKIKNIAKKILRK